jgi:hypothetical protein
VCTLAVKKEKKIRAGFDMSDRTIPLSVITPETKESIIMIIIALFCTLYLFMLLVLTL